MRLEYSIGGNAAQLKTVMRGIEREVVASNRRMAREAAKPTTSRTAQDAHVKAREAELKRIARAEEAEARRTQRYWERAHQKATDFRIRQTERAARAEQRATERAAAARARLLSDVRGGAARSVTGAVRGAVRLGGSALGLAGGFAAASALSETFEINRRASQLANQAGRPEIKGELAREATSVRGFTGMEALEGLGAFADVTGDLGAARGLLQDMSNVALATSTSLTDLAGAMGTAFIPIADQISDPAERLKVLNQVMRATAGMGAVGAVEVKDLASEMAGLAAASSRFTGDSERNLNMMVAMAQAARQRGGAASAAEAVTSVQRFSSDVIGSTGQKKLQALGVDVFADKTRTMLRDPTDILVDVLKKTKGDLTELTSIFGERGVRAVQGFSPLFTRAEAANAKLAQGQRRAEGEAGAEAVREEMDRFLRAAVSDEQVGERVASRLEDPDIRLKEAAKTFNVAIGESLAPVAVDLASEFAELAPQIAGITKALGKFVSFLVENPFTGIGAIVGANIAKDVASAGIANIIKGEVQGKLGAGLTGLGAGISVATMIVTAGILNFEQREANIREGGRRVEQARKAAAGGDVAAIDALIDTQRDQIEKSSKPGALSGLVEFLADMLLPGFDAGAGTAKKLTGKSTGAAVAELAVDSNRSVDVKSQEDFLAAMQALRTEATKAAAELAKVKAPGERDTRNQPIIPK